MFNTIQDFADKVINKTPKQIRSNQMGRKRKKVTKPPKPRPDFAKKYGEFADDEKTDNVRNSKFREWLIKFIEENKLHQRDVAELFGVNDSLIGHYIKGTRLPTYTTLQRIKVVTGIDINFLFGDEIPDDFL